MHAAAMHMLLLLLRMLAALPAITAGGFCATRGDCSFHGDCTADGASCVCDPQYGGDVCDVWSAPEPELLRTVRWQNCTHGWPNGTEKVMQLCKIGETGVCEAAGAPTVPPPDFNTSSCYGRPDALPGSN
eukprot:COSAG02_NODE_24829_length_676_cov_1.195841_1_plen_129_part_10